MTTAHRIKKLSKYRPFNLSPGVLMILQIQIHKSNRTINYYLTKSRLKNTFHVLLTRTETTTLSQYEYILISPVCECDRIFFVAKTAKSSDLEWLYLINLQSFFYPNWNGKASKRKKNVLTMKHVRSTSRVINKKKIWK